jgi:type 1 glutamine amidotransferase
MRTLLILSASAALALAVPAARGDEKTEPAKKELKVILIDGQNNHDWRSTTPLLKKHLEASKRFTVDVSSCLKKGEKPGNVKTVDFPPDLSKYDVVVSNFNAPKAEAWPKEFREDLVKRVEEGKIGLVIVHAANNAFEDWREYNLMIGLGWRGNKFGDRVIFDENGKEKAIEKGKGPGAGHGKKHAFKITVRDTKHPITDGMPREWMHTADELYHGLRGPYKGMRILATAYDDKAQGGTGEHEPMIWTVNYGKGRVFHTPMGHDTEGMRCVGFLATLQRGTEWAATGKVTIPLPKNFPTEKETSAIESGARR